MSSEATEDLSATWGHWECPKCTYHNAVTAQNCEMCSEPNPNMPAVVEEVQPTQSYELASEEEEEEKAIFDEKAFNRCKIQKKGVLSDIIKYWIRECKLTSVFHFDLLPEIVEYAMIR